MHDGQADCKAEWNAKRKDTEQINACRTSPFPAFVEDADEEDEAELTSKQSPDPEAGFPDELLEEGDRIWATGLFPQAEHIPPHLHDFHLVFSKDSFDELPGTKPWNHAVELTPDASPKSCKVYPLSASEQKELDAFLKENLESEQI